jgi:hypothetical protein
MRDAHPTLDSPLQTDPPAGDSPTKKVGFSTHLISSFNKVTVHRE